MNADTTIPEIVTAWAAAWTGTDPKALGALFTADAAHTGHAIGATLRRSPAGRPAPTR